MGVVDRIRDAAQEALGIEVNERGTLSKLRENVWALETFREEASELAYHALDYFSGRPQELQPEARNRLAQRSRIALMQDPLAGAEADLLTNFALGRGVAAPDAEDEDLQAILDEAWEDPVNKAKLTGFEAQRHRSFELITQANLFMGFFISEAGHVRVGFPDADTVPFVVTDPEDDERPLYYAARQRRAEFDFKNDRYKTSDLMLGTTGKPKLLYWPHWQNAEDYEKEMAEQGKRAIRPPDDKIGPAFIEHVRINRIGRSQFGTPPWARTLRFYTAMNDLTESHVAMAQAASTIIARRVVQGGPEQVARAASNVLSQTGEIAAARFGEADTAYAGQGAGMGALPAPGSFWTENQASKLESLSLNSGAAQAQQTAQIVRAPIAAASGFGQHYLGDSSTANLATATSLELPTTMMVQAWQETLRGMLHTFATVVVQEAVRAGRIGGFKADTDLKVQEAVNPTVGAKSLRELRIYEAAEKAEMERRTETSLKFTLSMPYPGRRNLPDVSAAVAAITPLYDPDGINIPFRRAMLLFFATHGLSLDDPVGFVDSVLPEDMAPTLMKGLKPDGTPYAPGEREEEAAKNNPSAQPPAGNEKNGVPGSSASDRGEKSKNAKGIREALTELFGDEADAVWEQMLEAGALPE